MVTVDSADLPKYHVRVFDKTTGDVGRPRGYLMAHDAWEGPAELATDVSKASAIQIKRQDNQVTVGIGHPHRF
jgi:hypothetical protein